MRYLTFALGKGRLANKTLEMFEKIGLLSTNPNIKQLINNVK